MSWAAQVALLPADQEPGSIPSDPGAAGATVKESGAPSWRVKYTGSSAAGVDAIMSTKGRSVQLPGYAREFICNRARSRWIRSRFRAILN